MNAPGIHRAARQAALTLHAMAPADRAWLLAALPATQRAGLQAMLDELGSLGIPRDASLLQALLAPSPVPPSHAAAEAEGLLRQEPARMRSVWHGDAEAPAAPALQAAVRRAVERRLAARPGDAHVPVRRPRLWDVAAHKLRALRRPA